MPRVLPGVNISISDQSQVILNNNTVLFGAVGEFSQGVSTPTLVTNKQQFTDLFGSYANTPAAGKKSYVGISNLLNSATGVYVSNVYTAAAMYAGQVVNSSNKKTAVSAQANNTSYTFTPYTVAAVTGATLGTQAGSTLIFSYFTADAPIQPSTVTLHATINGQAYSFTDNGKGSFVDSTGILLDTTNSFIHYNSGYAYVKFNTGKAPDNPSTITIDYSHLTTSTTAITGEIAGVGAGSALTFDYFLANTPIKPLSITVTATIVATPRTTTDTGVINSLGQSALADNTYYDGTASYINYETGAIHIVFKAGEAPTGNITINYTYQGVQMFAMIAMSPQTWGNSYGITISNQNYDDNTFYINEWVTSNGTTSLIQSYHVSRDSNALDGMGNRIYIQEVVTAKSNFWVCLNNTDVNSQIIPQNNANIFYNNNSKV